MTWLSVLGKYPAACKYWLEIVVVIDGDCILIAKTRRALLANENTEIPAVFANLLPRRENNRMSVSHLQGHFHARLMRYSYIEIKLRLV